MRPWRYGVDLSKSTSTVYEQNWTALFLRHFVPLFCWDCVFCVFFPFANFRLIYGVLWFNVIFAFFFLTISVFTFHRFWRRTGLTREDLWREDSASLMWMIFYLPNWDVPWMENFICIYETDREISVASNNYCWHRSGKNPYRICVFSKHYAVYDSLVVCVGFKILTRTSFWKCPW